MDKLITSQPKHRLLSNWGGVSQPIAEQLDPCKATCGNLNCTCTKMWCVDSCELSVDDKSEQLLGQNTPNPYSLKKLLNDFPCKETIRKAHGNHVELHMSHVSQSLQLWPKMCSMCSQGSKSIFGAWQLRLGLQVGGARRLMGLSSWRFLLRLLEDSIINLTK